MINYIQKKRVNYGAVQEYLKFSKDQNHYTNNGPVKRLLEDKISDLISLPSGKRVLCASNGTTALHAIMFYYDAINSGFKQSWISPAFTFPSCSVNASNTTIYDIDKESYTLREEDGKYSNVIITNLFGTVIPFKGLSTVTIYDNASSFLSKDNDGNNISLMGDMSFSSLHHTKTLGFGEGGFLVLPSELYDEIQRILGFGFNDARDYKELSSNFKMSDTAAAFILQHIDSYNVDRHLEIQNEFVSRLSGKENYELFNYSTGVFYGNLPILFNKNAEVKYFRDRCIEANKYYKPLKPLHNSIDLYNRIINFPLHEDITEEEINIICTTLDSYDSGN